MRGATKWSMQMSDVLLIATRLKARCVGRALPPRWKISAIIMKARREESLNSLRISSEPTFYSLLVANMSV